MRLSCIMETRVGFVANEQDNITSSYMTRYIEDMLFKAREGEHALIELDIFFDNTEVMIKEFDKQYKRCVIEVIAYDNQSTYQLALFESDINEYLKVFEEK